MTLNKEHIVKETEKAILLTIGYKYDENAPAITFTLPTGETKSGFYRRVDVWFPKSQLNENNEFPSWLVATKKREANFRHTVSDIIF